MIRSRGRRVMEKISTTSRRGFLNSLGVAVGGAGLASAGMIGGARVLKAAQEPPKGRIPDTPYKVGHMTLLTGAGAVLGEPSLKGHTMAAEEINAKGGLLGKRKIETITADEAAGTDANVKELRRMKLDAKIDLFTGVISSANTPALGPVAEELSLLTIFTDGCTDFLFDKADPQPEIHVSASPTSSRPTGSRPRSAWHRPGQTSARSPTSIRTTPTGATLSSTSPWRSNGCSPGPRSCRKTGRNSAPPTLPPTSPRSCRRSPTCWCPRSGAAITSPSTSRRCATACSTR